MLAQRPSSIAYYSSPALIASTPTSGTISAAASPRSTGSAGLGLPYMMEENEGEVDGGKGAGHAHGVYSHGAGNGSGSADGRQDSSFDQMEYLSSPVDAKRRSNSRSSLGNAAKRISALDRVLIQVTEDNERFSVVDVSGLWSAEAVKGKMLNKLRE